MGSKNENGLLKAYGFEAPPCKLECLSNPECSSYKMSLGRQGALLRTMDPSSFGGKSSKVMLYIYHLCYEKYKVPPTIFLLWEPDLRCLPISGLI